MYEWLQTNSQNTNQTFSPGFVSLYPGEGEEILRVHGDLDWVPNKDEWPMPDGYQQPPDYNPLQQKVSAFCKCEKDVKELHISVANKTLIHDCNGFCLKKKKKDSKTKYCRQHFGSEDPITLACQL